MTTPSPRRQRDALKALDDLFTNDENVFVIHYSCESFHDRERGRSPRITSIALRKLDSAQTTSFSIHQAAEVNSVPLDDIEGHYDNLEKDMLNRFFSHLSGFQGMKYLHWNMRDANYGFQAIEHRFRVLCGKDASLYVVDDKYKIDLARLLQDIYGSNYIEHPRMEKLIRKNGIALLDFLPGYKEAKAFEDRDFAALHLSTLRKVDVIANIALRAHDRNLKTNTTWWGMRGGRLVALLKWIGEHPLYAFVGVLASITAAVLGQLRRAHNKYQADADKIIESIQRQGDRKDIAMKYPQPLTPAALYARVSSDRQDVDLSVSAQLSALKDYAKANGYSVAREYVDEAESGRVADRPEFRKMIEEGSQPKAPFEVILVWKFSRFTRKREHAVAFKSMLRRKGIRVVSITEHADDSPTGKLMEAIIESVDEFYSENLAQDVMRGMREAASRGFFLGSQAPFGYRRVKVSDGVKERPTLEIDPATAPVVKELFESSLRGNGLKEICKALNDRGITNRGKRWYKGGLHYPLTNEAYTGAAVWGKTAKGEKTQDPVCEWRERGPRWCRGSCSTTCSRRCGTAPRKCRGPVEWAAGSC